MSRTIEQIKPLFRTTDCDDKPPPGVQGGAWFYNNHYLVGDDDSLWIYEHYYDFISHREIERPWEEVVSEQDYPKWFKKWLREKPKDLRSFAGKNCLMVLEYRY